MNKQILTTDWAPLLESECSKTYYKRLNDFLKNEYDTHTIYPPMDEIFSALAYTPFEKVKVVILGQDPYHGPNQAHGLSFSVQKGVKPPPSLGNIFKELTNDLGFERPNHGHLIDWAQEGVLLLNTVLTVRAGEANSHRGQGWEIFTNRVIEVLNEKKHPIVYILWGGAAQKKQTLIDTEMHYIIKAPHPSPLSAYRGFYESKPFSKTNEILRQNGLSEINWEIK